MELNFQMKDEGFLGELPYGEIHISGNDDFGFRPGQLMVSSIAVCSASVLKNVLKKKRLDVQDMKVTAQATRNPDEANRIEKINIHFVIKGTGITEDVVEKAVELARKHCPMVQSVKDSIEIEENFEIIRLSI
ncbi:OsmC family protein [Bacillus solimangrovi]|uniref:Osmotically inducible protein C n=1 Tax=Bacillus solimangrovi TaxID=1305675 RepID=A0A1E5LB91_9BACI|nr:OsmC family protein [Bacillus solimangrovi]OEH91333.1 osmotically inducible protein C [Bacillus solimangrovi]